MCEELTSILGFLQDCERASYSPHHCAGVHELVLPKTDHVPTGPGELPGDVRVPLFVAAELGEPVPAVATRIATVFGATMPEAAVDKNSEASVAEYEIWPAEHLLVSAPAGDPCRPEYRGKLQFRIFVAGGTDGGHNLAALLA